MAMFFFFGGVGGLCWCFEYPETVRFIHMCLCSRYTSHLLTKAKHVTAVDFMESFVQKNRENNGHYSNVSFIQADVTKLEIPKNRLVKFDLIGV